MPFLRSSCPRRIQALDFIPTSGNQVWNDNNNWGPSPPQPFPNALGAAAVLPAPTADLSIDLGQAITIGSLEIMKPVSPNTGNTTITGANTLTIDGGTPSLINRAGTGIGVSVIDVPVQLNTTLNVDQESNDQLRFIKSLSGNGGLTIRRTGAGSGGRLVALTESNSYAGNTTLSSVAAGDDWLILRLNNANAIPATSNLALGSSSVLEIASGSFTRAPGTGAGQINFTGSGRNGFAAFGGDRTVNLGGNAVPTPLVWGTSAVQVNFSQLVLGVTTSDSMVDLVNPIDLGNTNRNIRSYNGTGPIDGRISGVISGNRQITKLNDGVLSLSGTNTYSAGTRIEEGMLRLDSPGALPATGNVVIGQGATLGIGADTAPGDPNSDFARNLGTASGEIQMIAIGTNGNQANAGLSAHNGNRSVIFNGGTMLTWGTNSFLSGTNGGTTNRFLILSDDTADGTLNLKNPIDLNGANRQFTVRNGSANIDAELSGVLSGTGGGLVKENTGTLVLSNTNTYDGPTSVVRGRLLVNNTSGSGTGTGNVSVELNATLGGTGSISGNVTVNSGGHIAPGASIESLDVGGLTVGVGSILDFELGAPGSPGVTSDLLNVTNSNALALTGGTLNITNAGGLAGGTYTLINYAGTPIGDAAVGLLTLGTQPAGFTYSLVDNGANTSVDLVVSAAGLPGDYNNNGTVDGADYVLWRKGGPLANQVDDPNTINEADYTAWRRGSAIR